MKKLLLALAALVILAGGAFLVWQNLPEKRYARHMVKARLFVKQGNYTAALKEYQAAYDATGDYSPYVSVEVLKLTNHMNLQEKRNEQAISDAREFVRRNPRNQEGRIVLARLAFQLGQLETAFEALNALLAAEPSHYQGRLLLSQVRTRQGRPDLAEEQLLALAAAHPDSGDVLLPLAQNLIQQRKFAESRGFLRRMLARDPADTAAHLLLVEGFLKDRSPDSARAALDAWEKVDAAVSQPIAIQKARLASMLGDHAGALALLRPHTGDFKPSVPVLAEVALTHAKLGRHDSALRAYKTILDQNTPTRGAYLLLSHLLYLANKNPVKALEQLKMLEAGTKDRVYQRSLIATYLASGQENKIKALIAGQPDSLKPALEAFLKGLEPSPDFIGGWALFNYYQVNEQPFWMLRVADSLYKRWPGNHLIARSYAAQLMAAGALPQAAGVLSKVQPPALEDDLKLMEINRRLGRTAEALKTGHKLESMLPDHRGVNALLSDIYLARGEKAAAVRHAERELALDSTNIVCINNLAWIHGVMDGNLEKAMPYIARLEKVKNSDPRVLDTIGWILAKAGKTAEAEPYFELAVNILPDNPSLLYHIGWLKAQRGDKAAAAEYLRKSLALKGRFDEKPDAEKLLASLD